MYGVTATRRRTSSYPWVPDGALAHLDFVNGQYYADGSVWAVSQLLGSGFDANALDANGMAVWHSNANRPEPIGALASVIMAGLSSGMTVIGEMTIAGEPTSGASFSVLLGLADTTDFSSATWELNSYVGVGTGWLQILDFDAVDLFFDYPSFDTAGLNRFGYTLGRNLGGGSYRYAHSCNGEAAVTDDTAYSADSHFPTAGPGKITIGHIDDDATAFTGSYIRTLTVYAAVDETELATLTVLPTA